MNELKVFSYEGNEVRTVQKDGETWWVAKDVCDVFGETNRNRAMQILDEDEKGYTQMSTPGGVQILAIVNESGLYSLLFAMQPSKARGVSDEYISERLERLRAFRRWVTHEVLPTIRRTGTYSIVTEPSPVPRTTPGELAHLMREMRILMTLENIPAAQIAEVVRQVVMQWGIVLPPRFVKPNPWAPDQVQLPM